jgi:hypothetical protein
MQSNVVFDVRSGAVSAAQFAGLMRLVKEIAKDGAGHDEAYWRSRMPDWMLSKFAEDMTAEKKLDWLNRWRQASPARRQELEGETGWELGQWLHWFTDQSDMWSISDVMMNGDTVIVEIVHEDDPVPLEVFRWTGEALDIAIPAVVRVS